MRVLLNISFLLLFLSCSHTPEKKILIIPLKGGIVRTDPAFALSLNSIRILQQIYEPLIKLNEKMELVPAVAKRWKQISPVEYIFIIRKNILFHNNQPLKIQDVVFSLERLCDPQLASPYAWLFLDKIVGAKEFYNGKAKHIKGFSIKNDSTLSIKLTKPFAPFLYILTMVPCSIVPENTVKNHYEKFLEYPIGTGYFRFFKADMPRYVLLKKFPKYRKETQGNVETVFFEINPNVLTNNISFFKGKFHVLPDVHKVYKVLLQQKKLPAFVEVRKINELGTEFLAFRPKKNTWLFKEEHRRKLGFAIDRTLLCARLFAGEGVPANNGFLPKGLPGLPQRPELWKYRPELVNNASFLTLYCSPQRKELAEFLKHSFENIGIKTKILLREAATLRKEAREGKLTFWLASWLADYPDPENFLALFYSQNKSPEGPNRTHFENKKFDSLYVNSTQNPNPSVYLQAEKILFEKIPVIPLYYYSSYFLVNKNKVKYFPQTPIATLFPLEKVILQ